MACRRYIFVFLAVHLCVFHAGLGFYLPGIAPIDYEKGTSLAVMANKLTSPKNQVPYDYYSLDMCGAEKPENHRSKRVNLGQVLLGERSKPSEYKFEMAVERKCVVLCQKLWDKRMVKMFRRRVKQNYSVRLNLDNMPVVVRVRTERGPDAFHFGYPLGFVSKDGDVFINNHLKFTVLYHKTPSSEVLRRVVEKDSASMRVVGFEVEPFSVDHGELKNGELSPQTCPVTSEMTPQKVEFGKKITFTYTVQFVASSTRWATRWDTLLQAHPEKRQIQWFSIVNSLMISLFLTALVGTVLLRTVLRDFVRYNQLEEEDDMDEVTGWKLVHGDVFRPPKASALLAILCGSGAQVLWMTLTILIFALLGFLSPANRGGLLTAMLSLWVLASSINGYAGARLYGSLDGSRNRKLVTLGSAFLFPCGSFSIFFLLNLLLWASSSSGAMPFFTLILLLVIWFVVSVPLVFIGAYLGYKRKAYTWPCRTNQIPRQIPPTSIIPKPVYIVLAGILPFGTVFMELVFILNSLWQNQVYYMFGFLFAVFLILIVTCAEMSVVFTYLTLCNEDWKWWWQAFFTSASSGLYMFAYSIFYLVTQPNFEDMPFVSLALYLGYMLMSSVAFSLLCGTVGFYSSLLFTRTIFASVRVD